MSVKFVVTDLASGTAIGELRNASTRQYGIALNRGLTAACTIRQDNPLADTMLSGSTMLKVYDGSTIRFTGQVVTAEEVGTADDAGGSIAFTFANPMWRLAHRLLGKNTIGYTDGTVLSPIDKALLVRHIVEACNTDNYTGIEIGTITNIGVTGNLAYAPYKVAADAMFEVVNAIDGPDFELVPTEPTNVGKARPQIATLNVKAAIGSAKPNAIFEYGTGRKNVNSYRRSLTWDLLLNAGYGLPPVAGGTVVSSSDGASQTTYGLFEGIVPSDLAVDALRQKLVDEHIRVRKAPRQIITFDPSRNDVDRPGRVPQYGIDYIVGDTVPFRAVKGGSVRVNASMRVYGATFNVDEFGAAIPTLTLTAD